MANSKNTGNIFDITSDLYRLDTDSGLFVPATNVTLAISTDEDTPLTIQANDILANDTDVDAGDALTVTGVSDTSAQGAAVVLNGTNIDYDPTNAAALQALAAGESLTDTFTYDVSDGNGGTDTATVTVAVTGVDDVLGTTVDLTGFALNSDNGHYYQFVDQILSWTDAAQSAEDAGGYLATITSAAADAFIFDLTVGSTAWLGGSDAAVEGQWEWVTGPEAGTNFWNGASVASGGSAPEGEYANWYLTEPFFAQC